MPSNSTKQDDIKKPELEYEIHRYEDLESSEALFSAASESGLGKKPKATQWYQDFKLLAVTTHFTVTANDLRRRYHRIHSAVPERRVIQVQFK